MNNFFRNSCKILISKWDECIEWLRMWQITDGSNLEIQNAIKSKTKVEPISKLEALIYFTLEKKHV